jgi:hypothetical protein
LIADNRLDEAAEQLHYAHNDSREVEPLLFHPLSPLRAALLWADGELGQHSGAERAVETLIEAALLFHLHGDADSESGALHAAALERLPDAAFDLATPGRRAVAWFETSDDQLQRGRPFTMHYRIDGPARTQQLPPPGARILDVILEADGADVDPAGHTIRLDAWAPSEELVFTVIPGRGGTITMRVSVYDSARGALLQRVRLAKQDVGDSGGIAAA